MSKNTRIFTEDQCGTVKTLAIFIEKVCAGYVNTRSQLCCDGPNPDKSKCLVVSGKRCHYFERCVLPLLLKYKNYALVRKYEKIAGKIFSPKVNNTCNQCGTPVGYKRKLCDKCKSENRKKTYKQEKRRQRTLACPTNEQN